MQRRGRAEALRVEMPWRRNDLVKLVRLWRNEVRMARTDGAGETELLGAGRGRQRWLGENGIVAAVEQSCAGETELRDTAEDCCVEKCWRARRAALSAAAKSSDVGRRVELDGRRLNGNGWMMAAVAM